jgi:uncharacterized repeat protein (TIGR01451 family)
VGIRGKCRASARIISGVAAATIGLGLAFVGPGKAANTMLVGTVGPDYTITLTQGGNPVASLDPGSYTILVHDNSPMHDFHLVGPGVDETTDVPFTGDVTWTVNLAADGSYRFLCDPHEDEMSGTFSVRSAPSPSPTPPPPPQTAADVRVSITAAPASVQLGERVAYSVLVSNAGPDAATGVTLSDALPPQATFVEATSAAGCVAGATVRCAIGSIESGSSVALRIVLAPGTPGAFVNTISVAANQGDPQAGNNRVSQTTAVDDPSGTSPQPDAPLVGVTSFVLHAGLHRGRPVLVVHVRVDSPLAAVLRLSYRHERLPDRFLALKPSGRDFRIVLPQHDRHAICHATLRFTDEQGRTRSLSRTLRLP